MKIGSAHTRLLLVLCSCSIGAAQMTQAYRDLLLNDHNTARRSLATTANMISLTWDANLEAVAQNYLDAGSPQGNHNPHRTFQYQDFGGSGSLPDGSAEPLTQALQGTWARIGTVQGREMLSQPGQCALRVTELTGGSRTTFEWPVGWGGNGCSEQQNYWANHQPDYVGANGETYNHCAGGTVGHYTQVPVAIRYAAIL